MHNLADTDKSAAPCKCLLTLRGLKDVEAQGLIDALQEEGLRAVAHRRRLRLARQAAARWRAAVKRAREDRARERRTLEALADVRVGIRATPFKLHWPAEAPQESPVSCRTSNMAWTCFAHCDLCTALHLVIHQGADSILV